MPTTTFNRPVPEDIQKAQQQLKAHIEKPSEPLKNALSELRNGLEALPEWQAALQQAQQTGAAHQKIRIHIDKAYSEWLNLPFALLAEQHTHLYLSKSLEGCYRDLPFEPNNPLPLKILVMIASPVDTQIEGRLSYEEEEKLLLEAFEPLMQSGLVEVDYTDDGSLEALGRKLNENHYHILHFSGHGTFKNGEGYLELEDPETLRRSPTTAQKFADTLRNKPEHMPALILLSACKTAEGNDALQGTTQALLQCQIPAVIAMSHSIKDVYATHFSRFFYQALANKTPLYRAFKLALGQTKDLENAVNQKALRSGIAVQWLIPQLFVNQEIEQLVDWSKPPQQLTFNNAVFDLVTGKKELIADKNISPVFIGRRRDKARLMQPFMKPKPILLRGQGGIGKTNMAAYLIKRLLSRYPNVQPFVFTEKDLTIKSVFEQLENFFEEVDDEKALDIIDEKKGKAKRRLKKLFKHLQKHCTPVFLFDNIETFQAEKGGAFAVQHSDLAECIGILCSSQQQHVILTGRYGTTEFENLKTVDLHQVSLVDFWKKCTYLPNLKKLRTALQQQSPLTKTAPDLNNVELPQIPLTFKKVVEMLYTSFGGNYRILELLDTLIGTQGLPQTKELLQDMEANIKQYKDKVLQAANEDLIFEQLLAALQPAELESLQYLARFNIPVLPLALDLQGEALSASTKLDKLQQLTLLEKAKDYDLEEDTYYISPIIKELLKQQKELPTIDFKSAKAANYHYHIFNDRHKNLGDLSEAFEYFCKAKPTDVAALNDIGYKLSNFYYNSSLFRTAFYYAQTTVELLKEQTDADIFNRLGQILHLFGEYKGALFYYQQALKKYQQIGDKSGEGTILNNISQIYDAQGDYTTALSYLEKSLLIREQIGDKSGEGTTLSNMGALAHAQGDYVRALSYLEKSLLISEQIGDKSGEGTTLNNISQIYKAQGDYETALLYLEKSLLISEQIGNKSGEGATLSNMGALAHAKGDYETALSYLEKSLKIFKKLGALSEQGSLLNNISQIHKAQGDYSTALEYLEKSLLISEQIGDKSGEETTISNMGTLAYAKGDYERALSYFKKSLQISEQIGDKSGEGTTLGNMGALAHAQGDYTTALSYLEKSLKIFKELGALSEQGSLLNNISQIYKARGDYATALSYLEQSLLIREQIGDRAGEGMTLNNISQIYDAQGDYVTALSYLEKSLLIREQIGDKSGMIPTLHNMAMIALKKEDWEKYMKYEVPAYQLANEINEAQGIVVIGMELGNILCLMGQKGYDGLPILQKSLTIAVKAGMPQAARLKALIEHYS